MELIDRRRAPRNTVPEGVEARINGAPVHLVDLSTLGAKVEHLDRFALSSPELTIVWYGNEVPVEVRTVRTEIVGRKNEQLLYHTGLAFRDVDAPAARLIKAILSDPASMPIETSGEPAMDAPPAAPRPSLDDTWTRQVSFLAHEGPDLPYAQFRLTAGGWIKDYVESPSQPADGFTIRRERQDFDEFQRSFEVADSMTRRMMQVALETELATSSALRG